MDLLRKRAVRNLLVERVAGLRPTVPEEASDDDAVDRAERDALDQALRRARAMAFLAFAALGILFVTRPATLPYLPLDATTDTTFTVGVLAVAVFAGYRLGTVEKLSAIRKAHEETR